MNTISKYILSALGTGLLLLLSGCDNTTQYGIAMPDSAPAPGTISNIVTDNSVPGQITLSWSNDMSSGQETLYTKVTYFDPYLNKEVVKNVSTHAASVTISGTYVAGGEYTFTLTPVNATLQEGTPQTVSAHSTPIAPVVTSSVTPIPLTVDMLGTNAQEPSEGPIENAVDGNTGTFFHSAWSIGVDGYHNFAVTLSEYPSVVRLYVIPRSGKTNDTPRDVELWYGDGANWTDAGAYFFDKAESDTSKSYIRADESVAETETYKRVDLLVPAGTKTILFENLANQGGSNWFNFSEIGLEEVKYVVYDAEAEAKAVIDANRAK